MEAIRGVDGSESGRKVDGIAWVEHRVLRRPLAPGRDDEVERIARELAARGVPLLRMENTLRATEHSRGEVLRAGPVPLTLVSFS